MTYKNYIETRNEKRGEILFGSYESEAEIQEI